MDLYADDIKERLFVEVYNAKKLEGKLKNVVHECREDLVLVYRLSGYDERLKRDGGTDDTLGCGCRNIKA